MVMERKFVSVIVLGICLVLGMSQYVEARNLEKKSKEEVKKPESCIDGGWRSWRWWTWRRWCRCRCRCWYSWWNWWRHLQGNWNWRCWRWCRCHRWNRWCHWWFRTC
ncbi:hypothetical protein VIGAN_11242900 [Vigna angularis var. angularis]|uniref:Uncharacterized protein n=1 Tax=Vigna angularis var. angularis TaxID=157739 RepID=A0A0S3TCF9_PHAAN|nr:hypothetical protein VIGAN_11242900 [Vigna angularis var. angularis]